MTCTPIDKYFAEDVGDVTNETTQSAETPTSEEESEFNFIKSNNYDNSFFYSDQWLLGGGITLIVISIVGIVITLKPKKGRNMRHAKRNIKRR